MARVSILLLLMLFLLFTAVGGSFIKPSVLGTVAVTSSEDGRSLGFAIYYWLVNAGAHDRSDHCLFRA